ncbi:MAG: tRNA (adenosine(37)-N6)-threonylcarbamoyltransferase complex ATPase subunit type 1 TsaE [Dehalococcoidia bacterium]|nr:tRNA (adenosine(37)-N6)-threonylcarbamoyltransferase complex ATPase subunit type 1 TsaE [Dehalococcoidia bacterium]
MPTELEITTHGPGETRAVGAILGRLACPGDIIMLTGPLGTGKTCLVQGLAQGLCIQELIPSPTFMLAREYREGRMPLYHLDLYRLEFQEIAELGLDEYLYGQGIAAVEWAEKDPELMSSDHLLIEITYADNDARHVRLKACGSHYAELVSGLMCELVHKNES